MGYGRTGDGKTGPDGTRRDRRGTRRNQTESDGRREMRDGRRDTGDIEKKSAEEKESQESVDEAVGLTPHVKGPPGAKRQS
eukprot:3818047-Prymnesium_polylepis.1